MWQNYFNWRYFFTILDLEMEYPNFALKVDEFSDVSDFDGDDDVLVQA